MSKLIRNAEGDIIRIRLENVTVSYPYLTSPRPEGQLKAGSYGAEFIIYDDETKALVKEYTKAVAQKAVTTTWNNMVPSELRLPYREGDEAAEREEDALVVMSHSPKFQPRLFIRDPQSGRAHELTEDEIDEFYAGMLVDADVTIKPYNFNGKPGQNGRTGLTAYIGAVCKVGEGEPFASKEALIDSFSSPTEFDTDSTTKTEATKTSTKKTTKKAVTEAAPAVSLDDLLTSAPKKVTKQESSTLTLDDLLK